MTPQRQRIFEVLGAADGHPPIEAVYDAVVAEMPTISLKTVYQTVHELETMGEIALLDLGLGSLRIETNVAGAPHHHLVCRGCSTVRDLLVEFPGLTLDDDERQGFTVGPAEVVFRGLCRRCSESGPRT
jgi:Fe2+ or Zn2+ uptake regulation protein